MSADAWEDPTSKRWVRAVLHDMEPKLASSSLVISLVPEDREGDVKFWVELGASIMYDKPIIAVVLGDREIPAKLRLVADEVVHCPEGIDPQSSQELKAAPRWLPEVDP